MLLYRGGPCTRSQNCLDFATPDLESRKLATLQPCVRDVARPQRPHPFGRSRPFEAFRGLTHGVSRPSEAPEASTKSQNPLSLQDFEASGTRACNTIKGSPQGLEPRGTRAASLLSCEKNVKPQLAPSPLYSLFKTSRRTSKAPRPLKMILQAIAAASLLLDGLRKGLDDPELSKFHEKVLKGLLHDIAS